MTTVLVVGDRHPRHPGLRGLLDAQHDMTVVGKAADGGEAVRMSAELRPDVVVLDVRTPGMGSVEATRRITESDSRSRVLVLTTPDHGEYAYEALRAGAGGVCLKDARPDELVGAIRAMVLGDSVVSPGVTRGLIDAHTRPAPGGRAVAQEHRLAQLSPRERELLTALAIGATDEEIAGLLRLTGETVKSYVGRVLTATGARDRVQAVIFAYDVGLVRPV
ncbi:response regulator transcription factor [Streptomyces sp. SID13726]|uniref:response regulator n=1 Tax=Streptomyces sp. SID13726 TaxID=2706058 RepID=UPI0013BDD94C|nr:response regulator transcription factor [Streptomyces sp. SID13726]NEA99031.1 response regulator transcription factor [Streptomyces sp. SID13726]